MSDVQAQIDVMVASQVAKATNPRLANSGLSGDTQGSWRATSDGTTTTVEQITAPTAPEGRISDNGVNISAEMSKLKADVDRLQDRLNQTSYHQDTGQQFYILEPGSAERARVERELEWAKKRALLQGEIFTKLQAQRDADAKAVEAQRVKEAYVQGDPRKAQLLNEALERKRAEAVADRIFAADVARAIK